ncbi:hypothetical protein BDP27DRAFT_1330787 [Rhodocollybia butyracea]|uniref:Uncharacterized protein n=1 Tax=Rhodocollybia butyracea TaxID=206335 RepID=A0A9P5PIG8_9AGAR|nr:hypothetical protein BDP27DRAFT_1330787 [Rhodocollybia butyracea]
MPSTTPYPYSTPSRSSSHSTSTPTVTSGISQKLNVVTRVAIEGKAKQDEDSVSIRMYLKLSLPLDSAPGSTVQLFPEENVKILSSQVHPLDNNSTPYNFDSTLPDRSKQTSVSDVVDTNYTGHILISSYHISYVLPKLFPISISRRRSSIGERTHFQFMAAIDLLVPFASTPPRAPYLLSIPTPRCLHNNISLRIFPPPSANNPNISSSFASLSSISTDNDDGEPHVTRTLSTLHNNFADDESSDSSTLGFSTERIRVRWAKPLKSFPFRDTDVLVGVEEVKGEMTWNGVLMQISGLVPWCCDDAWYGRGFSGKEFNCRWGYRVYWVRCRNDADLKFPRASGFASRVNSTSSNASSTSSLLRAPLPSQNAGVGEYSFEVSPNASASASPIAPGPVVASGSVTLSSNGTDGTESISSLPASGFLSSQSRIERERKAHGPGHPVTLHINMNELVVPAHATRSGNSTFTFAIEGTIIVKPRTNSLSGSRVINGTSTGSASGSEGDGDISLTLPRFTVHAADSESMSVVVKNDTSDGGVVEVEVESSSPSKSSKSKTRSWQLQKGSISKATSSDNGVRISLKSLSPPSSAGVNGLANHKPKPNGITTTSLLRPPSSRGFTPSSSRSSSPHPHPHATNRTALTTLSKLLPLGTTLTARPIRDGPLMIPWVHATVTPLLELSTRAGKSEIESVNESLPESYAVRVCLPAPADMNANMEGDGHGDVKEWLEFGLARPGPGEGSKDANKDARPPKVDIVHVSVQGVPVQFETVAATAPTSTSESQQSEIMDDIGGVKFGEMSSKAWISWIRVHVGGIGGGLVVVDYVVKLDGDEELKSKRKGKGKRRDEVQMDVYLPSFALPVGRLEVIVEDVPGLKLSSLRTNLRHSQSLLATSPAPTTQSQSLRLLHYSTEEFFYPHLSFKTRSSSSSAVDYITWKSILNFIFLSIFVLYLARNWQVHHSRKALNLESYAESFVSRSDSEWNLWNDLSPAVEREPERVTVTITTTATTTVDSGSGPGPRWWMGMGESSSVSETSDSSVTISSSLTAPIVSASSQRSMSPPPAPSSRHQQSSLSSPPSPSPSSRPPPHQPKESEETQTHALTPLYIWNLQWHDFKPLAESTVTVLKRSLRPLYKVLALLWYGPE